MNDYIIETHDLTKKYGSQTSVSHLNIHVKKGHIYGTDGSHVWRGNDIWKALSGQRKEYPAPYRLSD